MSVLSETTQKQVEEELVKNGVITAEKLAEAVGKADSSKTPLFVELVKENYINNEALTKAIATVTRIPYVNLTNAKIEEGILDLLPREIAEQYMAVPLGEMQSKLVVAMLDAGNVQAVDFLSNKIGRPLKVYTASEEGVRAVLAQYGAQVNKEFADSFSDQEDVDTLVVDTTKKGDENVVAQDSPISKILTSILEYAATNQASDIHIEPSQKKLRIRCRIDGVMREVMSLPKATEPPMISRIKILANLKIDEHRIPQDGQFTIVIAKRNIDLRIAISPVVWGEQVVIRLLDKTGTSLELEAMGFKGRALRTIRSSLERPNGMVLTSGPTGSGKSTSMYALLNEIKNDSINIVTLEDPVEYKIDGVNQIQVNPEVGLTFATGLRSVLRQDPDIVMVGEIRDKETATLAVQAALTGHLVFSTLHTNSASGILPRLLDMGIEPFLIASTVRAVIGQRLVRRIGKDKETYSSDQAQTAAIQATVGDLLPKTEADITKVANDLGYEGLPLSGQNAYTLTKGKDVPSAPGGYKGRMGLYEVFEVTQEVQKLILNRAASDAIQDIAQKQGMISMRQDGYLKALAGYTTLDEVNRVAAMDSA